MRNKRRLFSLLITFIVVVAALCVGIKKFSAAKAVTASAGKNGTLAEQASLANGRLKLTDRTNQNVFYGDARELVRESAQIVVGTAQSNKCHLSADGKSVTTDYQVLIEEPLNGDLSAGSTITVSTPGGLHPFDKISYVYVEVPNYRKPVNGRKYVFFLDRKNPDGFYSVVGGFQAIFELPADGTGVLPSDRRTDSQLNVKYKRKNVDNFLAELRKEIRNR